MYKHNLMYQHHLSFSGSEISRAFFCIFFRKDPMGKQQNDRRIFNSNKTTGNDTFWDNWAQFTP